MMKRKWPKYIVMPVALLIYFGVMAVYSIVQKGGKLPDNFGIIVTVELLVIALLYYLLKKRGK